MKNHGRLTIDSFADPMFQENCLLLNVEGSDDCWVIDPGFAPQPEQVLDAMKRRALTPAAVVLTHCHVDHIAGIRTIRAAFPNVPILSPRGEEHMLTDAYANFSAVYGVPITAPEATKLIAPGDTIALGDLNFEVRDVAGHSPAGLAFYCSQAGVVIGGDALFAGSIGRYDFPGSSGPRLLRNIRDNLLTLPDQTVVYAGHGPSTTIGRERRSNAYLQPSFEPEQLPA